MRFTLAAVLSVAFLLSAGCAGMTPQERTMLAEIASEAASVYLQSEPAGKVIRGTIEGEFVSPEELDEAIEDVAGEGLSDTERGAIGGGALFLYTLARNRGWIGSSSRTGAPTVQS